MRLAYALPLLVLPSYLWRLPFAFHFPMGQVRSRVLPKLINERCRYTRTKPCERRVALAAGRGGQAAHDQVG
ncbi:hypothetical protein BJ999_000774 [Actinomadura citrea]|uniref:Uncharacterized protein n=1 Tax=Actinomadura citrea TaxID=46158 RepID=A0A7Y9KBZ2_9ACTN|nr:hypothetical protein [Actinomadura citrea]GGT72532.1 hypothetical protein GCM10010177_33180 [Actinomadura citrea]